MRRLLFIISICLSVTVAAQTLEECQQAAEQNYPLIAQYDLIARTTDLTISNIQKGWLPQLTASAQASYQNAVPEWPDEMKGFMQQMGVDMNGLAKDQYRVGLDLQQTVFDGGSISAQRQVAREQGAVQQAQLDVTLYQVRQRVNEMYFGLLLIDEQMRLNADLQAPDVETRKAILRQKLQNDGIEMDDEVIEYIAYNINTNVRELEGALISLIAQSSLNRKQITLDLTKQMIDKYVQSSTREITIDYIQKVVCDILNIPVDSIQQTSRKREIVQARQLSMYFAKKITKSSLAVIGMQCGNKDHATVLHACKTIENLRQTDRHIRNLVDELEKKFKE